MNISEIGERELVDRIAKIVERTHDRLLVGIGDDALLWRAQGDVRVGCTDTLVEGVHFTRQMFSWRDVGWKALAVSLSDMAAMGARPEYVMVSLALPSDSDVADVEEFYRGMQDLAQDHGVVIAGGDTTRADRWVVTVCVSGGVRMHPGDGSFSLLRSAAVAGEMLAVTGSLGAAAAALDLGSEASPELVCAQCRPRPHVNEGQILLRSGVRAAIDISDGLILDAGRLCRASGLRATIENDALPLAEGISGYGRDRALRWATSGGEDYVLLFTATEQVLQRVQRAGVVYSVIGQLAVADAKRPAGHVELIDADGQCMTVSGGWDPFR